MNSTAFRALVVVATLSSLTIQARPLGQQPGGDTVGGPGTGREVSNGGRNEGKGGGGGGHKVSKGEDSGAVKSKPVPAPAPAPKPAPLAPSALAPVTEKQPDLAPSPADVKIADNATIQKAEATVEKHDKTAAIINAVGDALVADPKEHTAQVLGEIVKAGLDSKGLCKSCEIEREADAKSHATDLGTVIVDQAKANPTEKK